MDSEAIYSKILELLYNIQTDDPHLCAFYASLAAEWLFLYKKKIKTEESRND